MTLFTYDQQARDAIGDALISATRIVARLEAQCIVERDFPSARDLQEALESLATAIAYLDGTAQQVVA